VAGFCAGHCFAALMLPSTTTHAAPLPVPAQHSVVS